MTSISPRLLRFACFELDLQEETLRKQGALLRLSGQPFALLALLAGRPGKLISREEIQETLWGADTYVDFDHGINGCIRQIRLVLGDQAGSPRFVETVPRRGYRFLAPVETVAAQATQGDALTTSPSDESSRVISGRRWRRAAVWVLAPILVLAVAAVSAILARTPGTSPEAPDERREAPLIVVLPFENLGADPRDEYLGEGLTEELISLLSRKLGRQLGVIARTSAMKYKGRSVGFDEITADLGVDFILEGGVRREGDRVRVTARLVQGADGRHLWAGNYDRHLADSLTLQSEVCDRIAEALALKLLSPGSPEPGPPVDPKAYELYLRGRVQLATLRLAEITESKDLFEASLEIDPGYAPAWAGLAHAYRHLDFATTEKPPRAREALLKALALDDASPEAHRLLAVYSLYHDWDLEAAREEFDRALALAPAYAEAHHDAAAYFSILGRHEEALSQVETARRLDPLSPQVNADVGWYNYFARRYPDAIDASQRNIEREPFDYWSYLCLQLASQALGDVDQIRAAAETQMRAARASPEALQALVDAGPAEISQVFWSWFLERLDRRAAGRYVMAAEYAIGHMALGNYDQALEHLEVGFSGREGWDLLFLRVHPLYDPLRGDPRFEDLVRRVLGEDSPVEGSN